MTCQYVYHVNRADKTTRTAQRNQEESMTTLRTIPDFPNYAVDLDGNVYSLRKLKQRTRTDTGCQHKVVQLSAGIDKKGHRANTTSRRVYTLCRAAWNDVITKVLAEEDVVTEVRDARTG